MFSALELTASAGNFVDTYGLLSRVAPDCVMACDTVVPATACWRALTVLEGADGLLFVAAPRVWCACFLTVVAGPAAVVS
ncbi:hypothetical protein AA101099_2536 [Neoasaia chiangmaiensis NBRC 101099]|nr:hypothetical protein AA101099_2536 [Neoasaia chiangmaiensis NBRC 101099]